MKIKSGCSRGVMTAKCGAKPMVTEFGKAIRFRHRPGAFSIPQADALLAACRGVIEDCRCRWEQGNLSKRNR
jgi:hypothetical protein